MASVSDLVRTINTAFKDHETVLVHVRGKPSPLQVGKDSVVRDGGDLLLLENVVGWMEAASFDIYLDPGLVEAVEELQSA